MNLPVFDCLIDENINDESGIYAISFVDTPAVEVDFVALSRHEICKEYLNRDEKKQVLTGVVLRPGQLIYRNDEKQGEHFIRFSSSEIEKIARKMMKTGVALHNTTHQHSNPLRGNYLTELWIVENPDQDKSIALGFESQPKGTLMCSYKIDDSEYWSKQVMTGNVKGFSLEGMFFRQMTGRGIINRIENKKEKQKMNRKQTKKNNNLLSKLTRFFLDIEKIGEVDETGSGMAYVIFVLAGGEEVYVDVDGFATLNDEQLPSGEHPLADGNILMVDEDGQFCGTKISAQKIADPEQKTAPLTFSDKEKKAADQKPESVDALKTKIAELESKFTELATLAQEANAEVQNLRKTTPSTLPLTTYLSGSKSGDVPRYEKMAQALAFSLRKNSKSINK